MKCFRGIGVVLCALLSVLTMSGNVALQPTDVYLTGGQRQHITYDGLGGKLSVEYSQIPEAMLTSPETVYADSEYKLQSRRSYVGPHVFRDGKLEYSAFAGGYFDPQGGTMYYLTDWQGNNAVVTDNRGNVVQETTYYPYGEPTIEPGGQRYLFGGKEREHAGGRNAYDFGARILTPYGSWSTPDPLVWKFYPLSPYSYCGGDPINRVDEDGEFWDTLWDIGNVIYDAGAAIYNHAVGDHETAKEHWKDAGADLAAALIPGVPAGVSKVAKLVKSTEKAVSSGKTAAKIVNETVETAAKSVKKSKKIGATGDYGENELKKLGGESQVSLEAESGWRRIDQMVGGNAHESKVGYTPYRKSIRMQVKKDAELIKSGTIKSSTWHFYRSSQTGKIGPSKPLKEALNKNDIKYIIHD